MARRDILDLFLAVALRPHPQCLSRSRNLPSQWLRPASTTSSAPKPRGKQGDNSLPSSRDPIRPRPQGAKVSLNVGLDRNPDHLSAISRIPIPKGEKGENFVPSVLARPLGLEFPPLPGQNTPIDRRSWQEKKEDFTDYNRALERRRIYLRSYFRPYFQEWRRVDFHKGKSFVSNDRLFKREKALYFPNIWGQTLSKSGDGPDGGRDTTDALMGKISIIGIQSGRWAEEQVDTFLSPKHNPQLEEIIASSTGRVQRADINIQGDWIRALLVSLFKGRLRQSMPEERWNRYFIVKLPRDVRRGLTEDVRDAMGLLNSQVGYVYLLDSSCKIRWAGSGHAWTGEVDGLNAAVKRLVQEESTLGASPSATLASVQQQKTKKVPMEELKPMPLAATAA